MNTFDRDLAQRAGIELTPDFIQRMHDQAERMQGTPEAGFLLRWYFGPFCFKPPCNWRCDIWQNIYGSGMRPDQTAWYKATHTCITACEGGVALGCCGGGHASFGEGPSACDNPDSPQCGLAFLLFLLDRGIWVSLCGGYGWDNSIDEIRHSDILSALMPTWTGYYRPLPSDFIKPIPIPSRGISATGISGTSPADALTQSVSGTQPAQSVAPAAATGTPASGLTPAMILIAVVIIILITR